MIAIVLGSGLGTFSEHFEILKREPYADHFNFEYETLDGHQRSFIWCREKNTDFLVLSGKLHFYEEHDFDQITYALKLAIEKFGVDEFVVTSASGGLGQGIVNGQWTTLKNIVSIPQVSIEGQIPKMALSNYSRQEASDTRFAHLPSAVYGYHQGPSLGTNAEYRLLDSLGVDLVGMSMYPEYRYLRASGIRAHFLSLPVCNYYPFDSLEEPSFEEVLKNSSSAVDDLVQIFKQYLQTKRTIS